MKPITAALWPFKRPELREAPISIDVVGAIVFRGRGFSKAQASIFFTVAPRHLAAAGRSGILHVYTRTDELITKENTCRQLQSHFEFDQGDLGNAAFPYSLRGIYEGQNSIDG
jgi:hypothetical protein